MLWPALAALAGAAANNRPSRYPAIWKRFFHGFVESARISSVTCGP